MFETIGIVAKQDSAEVKLTIEKVVGLLNAQEIMVFLDSESSAHQLSGQFKVCNIKAMAGTCDLIISVGGDGTLLECARHIYPREVPLLGINLGRLGFLTDLPPDSVEEEIKQILNGQYSSEERTVLGCEIHRNQTLIANSHALNDVVIQKWNSARLITLETYVDSKFVHSQRSDGIIVATPTGSTAYSLSGGGPILDPKMDAFTIVPICPHSLTNRPLVVRDSALVEVMVVTEREDESRVTCDGESTQDLLRGDTVKIYRLKRSITLIHPVEHDHFSTLRAKLNWGSSPC